MVPSDVLNTTDARVAVAFKRLQEYASVREQERWAMALAKTYHKRRQTAYTAYLKEYDSASIPEEAQRHFDALLSQINHQKA